MPPRLLCLVLVSVLFALPFLPFAHAEDRARPDPVEPGVIVVKFRQPLAAGAGASKTGLSVFDKVGQRHGVHSVKKALPFLDKVAGKQAATLQRVYYVRYAGTTSPETVAAEVVRDPNVVYAEPLYRHFFGDEASVRPTPVPQTSSVDAPSDTFYEDMSYLDAVLAPDAWDAVRGQDGRVIIAIVDGGTEWRHDDLRNNVWTNPGEIPGNGRDDDDNGFVDDVHGWNFATNSADPSGLASTPTSAWHGTFVAGVAAAVADNGIGVTGVSWNARFMPINTTCLGADGSLCYGFSGIAYAALNGADIINASWGGTSRSEFGEDVIQFAYERGALVVAAAGNRGNRNDFEPHYPSNYRQVLAVGATLDYTDMLASFSNYGTSVDVYAPGVDIISTYTGNSYATANGTSFSSPLAAGIAALVKTRYPALSVDELRETLRVTSDPIHQVNEYPQGQLGKGRVNAWNAISPHFLPALRVLDVSLTESGGDGEINRGDTVELRVSVVNYLNDATGVVTSLTIDDEKVALRPRAVLVADVKKYNVLELVYEFDFAQDTPDEYPLYFFVGLEANGYEDMDLFELEGNPPRVISHNTGSLEVSLTEQGNIGWAGFAGESAGLGFIYNGVNLLFEGGLILATSGSQVSDGLRNGSGAEQKQSIKAADGARLDWVSPPRLASQESNVVLDDVLAKDPIGVLVRQESFAQTRFGEQDYIILKYTLTNNQATPIQNLHAALFFDWDLSDDFQDHARWDGQRRMGVAQDEAEQPGRLVASRLLTHHRDFAYRSIDNQNVLYDGFSDEEKFQYLRRGVQQATLDDMDISTLLGVGPYTLHPGCAIEVAFGLIGAANEADLVVGADKAQAFWDEIAPQLAMGTPPAFVETLADISVAEGDTLSFPFVAQGSGGCTEGLRYSLLNAPPNATINDTTGVFTFVPGYEQAGQYTITTVAAIGSLRDTTQAVVTVNHTNRAPHFTVALADTVLAEGENLTFTYQAEDVDGDPVALSLVAAPTNTTFDPATGVLSFAPDLLQSGLHEIVVRVDDGLLADTARATVNVGNVNQPPHFTEVLPDTSAVPGRQLRFTYKAADLDEQLLLFSLVDPPAHAEIEAETGLFSFRAAAAQIGDFVITVVVTDGLLTDTTRAVVTVGTATPVEEMGGEIPEAFALFQNYPNPFNPQTTIRFDLPNAAFTTLRLYDLLGREVATLVVEHLPAAAHRVTFDAAGLPSGTYLYRLRAGAFVQQRVLTVVK